MGISQVHEWCHERLADDDSCCMDENMAPGVLQETIKRPDTAWTCEQSNSCYDETKGDRGADGMWYSETASCETPRVLYVHGGSWMYGSPFTYGYPQLISRLALQSEFVFFAPDYPLVPVGKYPE